MNQNEADLVVTALLAVANQYRDLGNKLILDTNSRKAGFNKFDSASLLDAIANRIESLFTDHDV